MLVAARGCDCTRSNIRNAESTQACVDSRSLQTTRSCVSPLRTKKWALPPERWSSSSSRMARRRRSPRSSSRSRSPSHRSRLSYHRPWRPSSSFRDELWLQADVPIRTSPAASMRAFRIWASIRRRLHGNAREHSVGTASWVVKTGAWVNRGPGWKFRNRRCPDRRPRFHDRVRACVTTALAGTCPPPFG